MAVGLKVTVMTQLEFAARLLPQVLVWAKSRGSDPPITILVIGGSDPPITILVIVMGELDRLVMVAVCGALVVPTAVEVKVRLGGANFTAVPLPLRAAVCVPAPSTTLKVAD